MKTKLLVVVIVLFVTGFGQAPNHARADEIDEIRDEIRGMRNDFKEYFLRQLDKMEKLEHRLDRMQRTSSHFVAANRRVSDDNRLFAGVSLTSSPQVSNKSAPMHSGLGAPHSPSCPQPCGCSHHSCCAGKVTGLSATKYGDCIKLCVEGCLPACVELRPRGPKGHYELTWKVKCCDVANRVFKLQSANGYFCINCCPYICVYVNGEACKIPLT